MQVGGLLQKRYRLLEKKQSVWLAEDTISQTICLLKPYSTFADPDVVEWLAAVWFPGIPRVHDQIEGPDGQSWVILEYLPGKTLHQTCRTYNEKEISEQVLLWMTQYTRLLTFLHNQGNQPLAHLDIKPDHLLLSDNGQTGLIDFGAARIFRQMPQKSLSSIDITAAGQISALNEFSAGDELAVREMTPVFAAPEQLRGCPCPASDIYALGLTMLCLMTGKSPSAARNMDPARLLSDKSAALSRIFERCLELDPGLRYDSTELLKADLERYMLTPEYRSPKKKLISTVITKFLPQGKKTDQRKLSCRDEIDTDMAEPEPLSSIIAAEKGIEKSIAMTDSQPDIGDEILKGSQVKEKCDQRIGQIICVWDGAEFGCELAAMMAETEPVLLIESDWFSPKSDLLLGINGKKNWLSSRQPLLGLDQVLVAQQQERLDARILEQLCESGRLPGLQTLRPHRDLHHYEYYPSDVFYQVIMLARTLYKKIILLCNLFIYDAYTCIGLMAADHIVIPLAANMAAFREYGRSISYLQEKSILKKNNIHFVAFSYNVSQDLSLGSMKALSGDRMLGCISEQKRRRLMRSGKRPYITAMSQQNRTEYQSLIKQLSNR